MALPSRRKCLGLPAPKIVESKSISFKKLNQLQFVLLGSYASVHTNGPAYVLKYSTRFQVTFPNQSKNANTIRNESSMAANLNVSINISCYVDDYSNRFSTTVDWWCTVSGIWDCYPDRTRTPYTYCRLYPAFNVTAVLLQDFSFITLEVK